MSIGENLHENISPNVLYKKTTSTIYDLCDQGKIPNAKTFKITGLGGYDPRLWKYSILKWVGAPTMEVEPYFNRSMNRHLSNKILQLIHLSKHRNSKQFWLAGYWLLRTVSLWILALHLTFPGWHRKYRYKDIKNLSLSVDTINLKKYEYTKVSIPKPDGTLRELGIPRRKWRLYLFGLNVLLSIWLYPELNYRQHGFIKRKGTLTAWWQIFKEVIDRKYIYEFDLRKFFDSIDISYLLNELRKDNVPQLVLDQIEHMFRSNPTEGQKHDYRWKDVRSYLTSIWNHLHYKTGSYNFFFYLYYLYDDLVNKQRPNCYYHGVSQGNAISPTLSNYMISHILLNKSKGSPKSDSDTALGKIDIVQYADDGILYSDEPFDPTTILNFDYSGITPNWEKSHWIKRMGNWERSLKFLGLRYLDHSLDEELKSYYISRSKIQEQRRKGYQGEIANATRTARDYLLLSPNQLLYEESDYTEEVRDFRAWIDDCLSSFIQAGLYRGSLDASLDRVNTSYV